MTLGACREATLTRIWVEDRGPGVAEADKPFVFDRAFRGDAGATSPRSTGLGLAIATDIVRANGGTLSVEDAQPKGARFVLTLPARVREGES